MVDFPQQARLVRVGDIHRHITTATSAKSEDHHGAPFREDVSFAVGVSVSLDVSDNRSSIDSDHFTTFVVLTVDDIAEFANHSLRNVGPQFKQLTIRLCVCQEGVHLTIV